MYENIKVIVADIDNTLKPTKLDIPQKRVIDTIEKLRSKGYLFGLASGRPYDDVEDKYKEWGMEKQFDFIVGWNGCQLYDDSTKQLHKYNYLKKEDIKEIIEFMEPYDTVVSMYEPEVYLCNKENERAWFSAWKNHRSFECVSTYERFYKEDNGGIMFRTTVELMPEIEEAVSKQTVGKDYIGFKTQADLMEFSHKDSNKGFAFKKYCELHNISLDDCMAFGDTSNDNEMLKCCHGICLLNGSDDTKACAERITETDCQNEGFADFIEKYILRGE